MWLSFATWCRRDHKVSVERLWTSNENLGAPHVEVDGPARERARGQRTGEGVTLLPLLDLELARSSRS